MLYFFLCNRLFHEKSITSQPSTHTRSSTSLSSDCPHWKRYQGITFWRIRSTIVLRFGLTRTKYTKHRYTSIQLGWFVLFIIFSCIALAIFIRRSNTTPNENLVARSVCVLVTLKWSFHPCSSSTTFLAQGVLFTFATCVLFNLNVISTHEYNNGTKSSRCLRSHAHRVIMTDYYYCDKYTTYCIVCFV